MQDVVGGVAVAVEVFGPLFLLVHGHGEQLRGERERVLAVQADVRDLVAGEVDEHGYRIAGIAVAVEVFVPLGDFRDGDGGARPGGTRRHAQRGARELAVPAGVLHRGQ